MITAVDRLITKGAIFNSIVGGGEENILLPSTMVSNLKHDKIMSGFAEGQAKVDLLRGCDVFVLPSFQENFGCGRRRYDTEAVLIGNVIALSKEVAKVDAGLTFPPEDVERLMVCIREMMSPDLREKCGRNGRQLIVEKYSLQGLGKRLEEMYSQVLSKS